MIEVSVDGAFRGEDGKMKATILKTVDDDKVKIVGSSGVAVAWILHHYLKYYCNSHISWETSQLDNCHQFPVVNATLEANDLFRYYQNVCTAGYSFVWWQWSDWETHIDWMALNGINLPLAFSGQERGFSFLRIYSIASLQIRRKSGEESGRASMLLTKTWMFISLAQLSCLGTEWVT